ncbi:CHASE3 domain-containing protein [uncultured Cocleimonas sp.]|uniref:CHASE3 domain-containing protein n=1 Tax=uncultured Cocleimonas sp. TaxID=1051587 RepID=UPI00261C3631|nr:CHASE3 domain-containing protein [uncultured Cocleimonas sp.]
MDKMKKNFLQDMSRNRLHILFSIFSAIIIILFVFFLKFVYDSKASINSTRINALHLDYSDRLLINMLNIQTGARGYLLSDDPEFLEPYNEGIKNLENTFDSVEKHWPDYLSQREIDALESEVKKTIVQISDLVSQKALDQKTRISEFDVTKKLMDSLRDRISEIRQTIKESNAKNTQDNLNSLNLIKWLLILLILIAFGLLFLSFALTERQQKMLKNHADDIALRNKELEKTVNQRTTDLVDLASHVTTTSENEKQRLARELHDELGALLTAARMDSTWISRSINEDQKEKFETRFTRLIDSIDKSIALKRHITTSLVPPLLREMGLHEAIIAMTENDPNQPPATYHVKIEDSLPELDKDRELALYRICQESINNIWKYANATEVFIELSVEDDFYYLTIKDNGEGFDQAQIKKGTHGLAGIRARAAMFKGTMEIESAPGKGTIVKSKLTVS